MRLAPRVIIPVSMFMLLIGYQNFSGPVPGEWDSQSSLKVIQEMHEFQKNDPGLPNELAMPQGGSDLESVRNNWAERQGQILLNGFDKKIENAVNDKINAFVQSLLIRREPENEPFKAKTNPSDQASIHPPQATPAQLAQNVTENKSEQKKPRYLLKFPRPNMIKYEVSADASLNLIANPGETLVSYSQAYSERTRLGIEHATSKNVTQMFFRYDW